MTRRLAILTLFLAVVFQIGVAWAESAPLLMNFQGRLTNSVGSPVTTAQTVDFSLIEGGTDTTGGTIVYQEQSSVTPDANGVFAHVIGTGTPLGGHTLEETDLDTSGAELWVELTIAGNPLLPRTRILSVAYAIEASRIDGKTANDLLGQGSPRTTPVRLVWNDDETIDVITRVSSDITLQMNDDKYYTHSGALTWSFNPLNRAGSTEGLGLDTGTVAANTWYYLYAIPHTTDIGDFTVVASVTPPPAIDAGPLGSPVHKYLGAIQTSGSSDVHRFHQAGKSYYYMNPIVVFSQGSMTHDNNIWAQLSLALSVPETAGTALIQGKIDSAGNQGTQLFLSGITGVFAYHAQANSNGGTQDATDVATWEVPLFSPQTMFRNARINSGSGTTIAYVEIRCMGWEDSFLDD